MTRLILVRHGHTPWNHPTDFKLQGQTDVPLSEEGERQAKVVAKRLKRWKIDIIYTSKLMRAIQTSQEIAHYHPGVQVLRSKELNEIKFGIIEGMTIREIKKKYKGLWEKRSQDIYNFKDHKGENFRELEKRVCAVIDRIVNKHKGKNIAIVAHGGVFLAFILKILGIPPGDRKKYMKGNTGISVVHVRDNSYYLKKFNDTKHLTS